MILFLVVLGLAGGVLAFGGVYGWAHPPLLTVMLATGIGAIAARRRQVSRPVALAAAVLAAAILVQLVPIPRWLIRAVSPGTDALLNQLNLAYALASDDVGHALSVDPAMTAGGLMFFAGGAVWTLGLSGWLTRARLYRMAACIVVLGVTVAIAAFVQREVTPQLIYGFWKPFGGEAPFGPFVNRNHFAGWMLMAIPLAFGFSAGLLSRHRDRMWHGWREVAVHLASDRSAVAVLGLFGGVVMALAFVLSLSRSGILVGGAVMIFGAAFVLWRFRGAVRLIVPAAIVVAGLSAVQLAMEPASARFASLDSQTLSDRIGIWRDALRMAADMPLSGVGLRAFGTANLVYQSNLREYHVSTAHNDWLQIVAEGGVLLTIPAAVLLAVFASEVRSRFREHHAGRDWGTTYWIRIGAVTGLVAIGLQSFVEFSLQMPGNLILFVTLCAMAMAPMPLTEVSGASARARG